ncbi:MAG: MaoC family dehydratase N-terminal domain-containing protein, partial [Betaproteobacteria bacterium]|nr:MaoC family dehydratase N-terminal domain-containing protein [Betaproteobacteria bacterium]
METVGIGRYFEDLAVGTKFKTIGRTITETDIVNFINCTGMVELLFTNMEFLKNESPIKQRIAPAALVYSMAEGLIIQSSLQYTGMAFLEMDLKVHGPVAMGDTIHVEVEVTEAKPSQSKPGRGIVRTRNQVVKQDGK